ncbi:MAG: hypothetical protein ABIQ44_09880 [Chloroflexia bacterium]
MDVRPESSSMFAVAGRAREDMWSLGRTGKLEESVSVIWHTWGYTWQQVPGPNVGATVQWREIDILEDETLWLTGDSAGKIVLAKFVSGSCSGSK